MTSYTWEDFPVRQEAPVLVEDTPRQRVVRIAGTRYLELPDNGYELLLAWIAGPDHVCRIIDRTERTVKTTIRRSGRPPLTTVESRAEEDWQTIDDFVNSSLRDAGVPSRPRGYTWYLELPDSFMPRDVWRSIRIDANHSASVASSDIRAAMTKALSLFYPPPGQQ